MSLRDLGLGPDLEALYLALLRDQALSLKELSDASGLNATALSTALESLTGWGLVKVAPDAPAGVTAVHPAVSIGQLIEAREDEYLQLYRRATAARAVIPELEAQFEQTRYDRSGGPDIEHLEDVAAIRERIAELAFFSRKSVYAIQPGGPQSKQSLEASRPLDERGIRRGIDMRVIHETSVLEDALNRDYLRELAGGGVKIKVTDERMDRMVIMDEEVAIVPVDPADSRRGALVVRHPGCCPASSTSSIGPSVTQTTFHGLLSRQTYRSRRPRRSPSRRSGSCSCWRPGARMRRLPASSVSPFAICVARSLASCRSWARQAGSRRASKPPAAGCSRPCHLADAAGSPS